MYDDRDRIAGEDLDNQLQYLRIRFMQERDYESIVEICEQLVDVDDEACSMSIGIRRGDDTILFGESIG